MLSGLQRGSGWFRAYGHNIEAFINGIGSSVILMWNSTESTRSFHCEGFVVQTSTAARRLEHSVARRSADNFVSKWWKSGENPKATKWDVGHDDRAFSALGKAEVSKTCPEGTPRGSSARSPDSRTGFLHSAFDNWNIYMGLEFRVQNRVRA